MQRIWYLVGGIIAIAIIALIALQGPKEPENNEAPPKATPPQVTENILSKKGVEVEPAGIFAFPGKWEDISTQQVTLFYPAQASWEWLTSDSHPGKSGLEGGTPCASCHQENTLGEKLVKHSTLEPDPITDKQPTLTANVKAAYDDQYLYLSADWPSEEPGITHTLWRFNGTDWEKFGGPKPDVTKKNIPPSYEDRLTLLLADKDIPASDGAQVGFSQAGCFITCHSSMRMMPNEPSSEQVTNDPYWGPKNKKDIRKYLLITRSETDESGGWNKVKSSDQVQALLGEGLFLDLWQARGSRSLPIGYTGDDYVLEYRNSDAGKGPFSTPSKPEFMYDRSQVDFTAIPEEQFKQNLGNFPLIQGKTAQDLAENAEFRTGDLLPQPVLRTPEGSAADILANGTYKNGRWTVEMRRKLDTGNPDDKALQDGQVYRIGLAIFDDNVSNRRHYVSFVRTLGLGIDADIKAEKL